MWMRTKPKLMALLNISVFFLFILVQVAYADLEGYVYKVKDGPEGYYASSSFSSGTLHFFFDNAEEISTQLNEDGSFEIDPGDLFCWEGCNIYPAITLKEIRVYEGEEPLSSLLIPYSNINQSYNAINPVFINLFLDNKEINDDVITWDSSFISAEDLIGIQSSEESIYFVSWNGTIVIPEEEEYFFSFEGMGSVNFWIDGQQGIFKGKVGEGIKLTPGEHELRAEYFILNSTSSPNILWRYNEVSGFVPLENLRITSGESKKVMKDSRFQTLSLSDYGLSEIYPSWSWWGYVTYNTQKRPLLLIHGWSNNNLGPAQTNLWTQWGTLPGGLENLGDEILEVVYNPANLDNRKNAGMLNLVLSQIKNYGYNFEKIDVAAHSMGGLAVRGYIQNMGLTSSGNSVSYGSNIRKAIFIGSPLQGTYLANLINDGYNFPGSCDALDFFFNLNVVSEATKNMEIGSDYLWNLNTASFNSNVDYLTIGGFNQYVACLYNSNMVEDGVVPMSSSNLLGYNVPHITLDRVHTTIVDNPQVLGVIDDFLNNRGTNEIKSNLYYSGEYYIDPSSHYYLALGGITISFTDKNRVTGVQIYNPTTGWKNLYQNSRTKRWFYLNPVPPNFNFNSFTTELPVGTYNIYYNEGSGFFYSGQNAYIDYDSTTYVTINNLDSDNDGIKDVNDNCPYSYNPNQANYDGDSAGDNCDPDDDNDGFNDNQDVCQFQYGTCRGCPLNPNWTLNSTWSACTVQDTQFKNYYDTNMCGQTPPPPVSQACNFCNYSPTNTSWSFFANVSLCRTNDTQLINVSRKEYDSNYASCYQITGISFDLWNNGQNKTHYTTNQTSCDYCYPIPLNSSWGDWYNITVCRANKTKVQEREKTEFDSAYSMCYALTQNPLDKWNNGNNKTHYQQTTIPCCDPILTNTSPSQWTNVSCLINDTMNQTRFKIEYDSNSCGTVQNRTIIEYQQIEKCDFCKPNPINTSWSPWQNATQCMPNDKYVQNSSKTEYDANYQSCYAVTNLSTDRWNNGINKTYWNFTNKTCDFCTPSWSCSGYGACQMNGTQRCNAALDANSCFAQTHLNNDNYPGNYSEFPTNMCPIECSTNSDCNDGNQSTEDSCINASTIISNCTYSTINCFTDSECGETGFIGSLFCGGNDIQQNYQTATCSNPGTSQSNCSVTLSPEYIQTCDFACFEGVCKECDEDADCNDNNAATEDTCQNEGTSNAICRSLPIRCFTDIDCGINGYEGDEFCSGDNIQQEYRSFTCLDPATSDSSCTSSTTPLTNNICDYACLEGSCIRCNENADCNDNNSLTADTCINPATFQSNCSNKLSPLVINSPADAVFGVKRIPVNISTNEAIDEITYRDLRDARGRERTLCSRGCEGYGNDKKKTITFNDGEHEVSFKAYNPTGQVIDEEIVTFRVDSKKPKITKTSPTSGFGTGIFEVEFKEENPAELMLHYGSEDPRLVNIEDECTLEKDTYACAPEVDVSQYDGSSLSYWFGLKDIAGSMDSSRPRSIDVDITPPVINSFGFPPPDGRSVTFTFNVTEQNFDSIKYEDWSNGKPKTGTLCTRLKNGICEARKTFSKGSHNVIFTIADYAGNEEQTSAVFTIT